MVRLPILLIHGFNGAPSNWTGRGDAMPEFLAQHGFDPALIRVFNYGYAQANGKRYYNNTGDIREIARRLDGNDTDTREFAIDQLSRDSVARGGPAKITIIAHSSGGLIARYYLTRHQPDEWGTRYRGKVGRVIFLGTPHQGVDLEDILDPLPKTLTYGLMIRFHYLFPPDYHGANVPLSSRLSHATGWHWLTNRRGRMEETPGFQQMHPGSDFLSDINRTGAMPKDVEYFNIVGNIHAQVHFQIGRQVWIHRQKHFGDFLVTVDSAGRIPNADAECFSIDADYGVMMKIGEQNRVRVLHYPGPLPIHRHLRRHPAIRQQILRILAPS